ncbi:MAG: transcription factor E [Candidatus Syntropharchaeia archaeon]
MATVDNPVISEYLKKLVGKEGLSIIKSIPSEEMTDEKIAEISGLNINTVRRILYVLYENRMAEYRRERNSESGWLTYFWKIDLDNIERAIEAEVEKFIRNLKKRLEWEKNNLFYVCECGRFVFDEAVEVNFVCPRCGANLEYQDNTAIVEALEKRISQLEKAGYMLD